MNTKKLSYPKPLPQRMSSNRPYTHAGSSDGSGGWLVIFGVALAFVAMIALALGGGKT